MNMRSHSSGFSLIKLLVLLMILDLIAGLLDPHALQRRDAPLFRAAEAEVQRLSMSAAEYYTDNGTPPRSLEELLRKPSNARNWNGPYIKETNLHDPWNNAYQYRYPGERRSFDIWSHGADGSPGGEGNDADITNWD